MELHLLFEFVHNAFTVFAATVASRATLDMEADAATHESPPADMQVEDELHSLHDNKVTIESPGTAQIPASPAAVPGVKGEELTADTLTFEPSPEPSALVKAEAEQPSVALGANPAASTSGVTVFTAKKKKLPSTARKESTSTSSAKPKKTTAKKAFGSSARPKSKQGVLTPSPAPSADEAEAEEEEDDEDPNLYCICQSRFNDVEGGMIMCDRCDQWYHYKCMGITHHNVELVDQFICPPCETQTGEHTTYKEACARTGCLHTAMKPFSRYCSQRCGVLHMAAKMQALKLVQTPVVLATLQEEPRVKRARKAEGNTETDPDHRRSSIWNTELQRSVLRRQTFNMTSAERFTFLSSVVAGPSRTTSAATCQSNGDHSQTPTPDMAPTPLAFLPGLQREPAILRNRLTVLDLQKAHINAALDSLDQRSTLLHLVSDRAPTLPHVGASAVATDANAERAEEEDNEAAAASVPSAKSKSSKKKKSIDTSGAGGPRCGYDERLHWDDERFNDWAQNASGRNILSQDNPLDGCLDDEASEGTAVDTSSEIAQRKEEPRICGLSKRKCKRHVDWSNLKEASFDVEKSVLNHDSQKVTEEKLQLERYLQEVTETIDVAVHLQAFDAERRRIVEAKRDEDLARQLASEGSRRQRY